MKTILRLLALVGVAFSAITGFAVDYPVETAAEFKTAVANAVTGDMITLVADIELAKDTTYEFKKSVILRSGAGGPYTLTRNGKATIKVSAGELTIDNVVMDGSGNLDAGTTTFVYLASSGAAVTLGEGTVVRNVMTKGDADGRRGSIQGVAGTVINVAGAVITNCTATVAGGAIYTKGTVNLTAGSISGNSAGTSGGAIYCAATTAKVTVAGSVQVTDNLAKGAENNVELNGAALELVGTFTGQVGVNYPTSGTVPGSIFGSVASEYDATMMEVTGFRYDGDPTIVGWLGTGGKDLVWLRKCAGYSGAEVKSALGADEMSEVQIVDQTDFAHAWLVVTNDDGSVGVRSSPTLSAPAETTTLVIELEGSGKVELDAFMQAAEGADASLAIYQVKGATTNLLEFVQGSTAVESISSVVCGGSTLLAVFTGDTQLRTAAGELCNLVYRTSDGTAENPFPITSAEEAAAFLASGTSPVHLCLEQSFTGSIEVPAGCSTIIDLNGQTLTGDIAGGGDITVVDFSEDSAGCVSGTVSANGQLTIAGGTYSFDPENQLAADAENFDLGDGTWHVQLPLSTDVYNHVLDTRPGVRVVLAPSDVLPITYSGTEWKDLATTKGTASVSETPSYESKGPDYRTYENILTDNGADAYTYSVPKSTIHNPEQIYTVQDYTAAGSGTLEGEVVWDTTRKTGLWRVRHVINGETLIADYLFPNHDPIAPPLNDDGGNDEPSLETTGWTVEDDVDHPWLVVADPTGGDNQVVTPSVNTESLNFTVVGDGEFRWSQLFADSPDGSSGCQVTVLIDGEVAAVFSPGEDAGEWEDQVVHVQDSDGNDNATHTITMVYEGDDSGTDQYWLDDVTWSPATTQPQMLDVVVVPEGTTVMTTTITNELNSGWMPVADAEDAARISGVRTPDGPLAVNADGEYVSEPYESSFGIQVLGSGTLDVGSLAITDTAVDEGKLTVVVDGEVVAIFDSDRESAAWSYAIAGDEAAVHVVEFVYEREATSSEGNSSAELVDIVWTPSVLPPEENGGVTWMTDEGKALMIVDHQDCGPGYCHLAFNPQLKHPERLNDWVERTAAKGKIKAKVGLTRAAMEKCAPLDCTLRSWSPVDAAHNQVWVKVQLPSEVSSSAGYWRVWVAGSTIPFRTLSGLEVTNDPIALDGANSVNVFGIVKVESTTTNTIVAIPWTWYSALERESTPIPAAKLVKTANLTPGDMLYASTADGIYTAWTVVTNSVNGGLEWEPIKVVMQDTNPATGGFHYSASGSQPDLEVMRGRGMWLSRNHPVDADGKAIPFWLYGQSVVTNVSNTVRGGSSQVPAYTMLANPFCEPVALNDLGFDGNIGEGDRIIVPNGEDGSKYVQWSAARGWFWVESRLTGTRIRNVYHTEVTIPPGTGFWYVRRSAGDLTLHWVEGNLK